MIRRIVIARSRNYNNYEEAKRYIDFCISDIKKQYTLVFMSGGCYGTDKIGEKYAFERGYKIERYPAKWEEYGKGAGPRRNRIMAEKCDYVICFWDGESKGTKSMIEYAKIFGKPLKIKIINKSEG